MIFIKEVVFFLLVQTTLTLSTILTQSQEWQISSYSKLAPTYGKGALDDEVDWWQHPCKRECKDNESSMTCRYGFTIENYLIMSKACYDCPFNKTDCYRPHCVPGDGNLRAALVVNRRLPGPTIEVCKGDRIIVDVKNRLNGQSTTIHWHGLQQRGTPFMDGVPMVSQCPIAAKDSFRYEFIAENAGTHWWHAHSDIQRGDGIFGGLIVRSSPSVNRVGYLYDWDEHLIIVNEWNERSVAEAYSLQYLQRHNTVNIRSIFVNGLGRDNDNTNSSLIPQPVFQVKKGFRYRFRLIQAGSFECSFSISVDRHPLLAISTDGRDVKPVEVDAIRMMPGERYDFVLHADREVDNYWIHISSAGNDCGFKHQEAILRYEGAPDTDPVVPSGSNISLEPGKRILNPANQGSEADGAMCIPCSLTSIEPDDDTLAPIPDHQLYLNLDVYELTNPAYHRKNLYDVGQVEWPSFTLQINHLSYKATNFPLQTQPELIRPNQLCNVAEAKCTREQCSCPHVIKFKLNSTVEIIFVNEAKHRDLPDHLGDTEISHGMHMHGFYYRVVAMEKLGRTISVKEVRALDQAGGIRRKFKGAPWKDVIEVPSGGYTVVRFRADNPGYWFMHCHLETHVHNGMAMVIKVGEHEDFPPVPKDFPKCHYHP